MFWHLKIDLNISSDPNATAMQITRDGAEIYSGYPTASFQDTGLDPSSTHDYLVSINNSISTVGASATAVTAPLPPTIAATAASSNEVDLTCSSNSASSSIFHILRDGVEIGQTAAGAAGYNDSAVLDASTYSYTVIAAVNGTTSAPSNAVSVSTPLAAPSGVTLTAISTGEIDVTWTNNSQATDEFYVYRSTDGISFTVVATATGTTCNDTTVTEGTDYWYKVQALHMTSGINDSSVSPATDCWSLPAAPSDLTVTEADANQINLSWTNNSCPFRQPHLQTDGVTRHHATHLEDSHGFNDETDHNRRLAGTGHGAAKQRPVDSPVVPGQWLA